MLSEWQVWILDNGAWLLPIVSIAALSIFPWKHWNSLWEVVSEERNG